MALSRLKFLICVAISFTFLVAPFALDIYPDGKAYAGGRKANNSSVNLPAQISVEKLANLEQAKYRMTDEGNESSPNQVPEPSTFLLLGFGLVAVALSGIKKFKK